MDEDKLYYTEGKKSECAIKKKKMQRMRLHMMCRTILTPLMYSDTEESFSLDLTCQMKERA